MKHIKFDREVIYAQAKNTLVFLQVGSWALWLGEANRPCPLLRFEFFPPMWRTYWKENRTFPIRISFSKIVIK